jgi:hypothetical protein
MNWRKKPVADEISPADLDEEWLLARAPSGLSDAQVESFQEKVAILVCEGGMTDDEARRNAFNFMFGDRI